MQITSFNIPNDPTAQPTPPGNAVSATSRSAAGQPGDTGHPTNFANIVDLVVVGDLSEHAMGRVESYFRALNSVPDSSDALRQLRQQTERQGVYPILVFEDGSNGKSVTLLRDRTARPGEQIDLQAPAASQPPGGQGMEQEIMGLIGRVADGLSQAQREHESFLPALSTPLPSFTDATMAYLEQLQKLPPNPHARLNALPELPNRLEVIGKQHDLHTNHSSERLRASIQAAVMNLARMAGVSRAEIEANQNQAEKAASQRP